MQTEQKINAKAVFVLPFVLLVLMVITNEKVGDFYSSPLGIFVIAIGSGILSIGMFIVARLGRIPVETRVFAASYGDAKQDQHERTLTQLSNQPKDESPFGVF